MKNKEISTSSIIFSICFFCLILVAIIFIVEPLEKIAQYKDNRLYTVSEEILNGIKKYETERGALPWASSVGSKTSVSPLSWKMASDFAVGICGDDACSRPGEALSIAGADQSLVKKKAVFNIWREIYISRGALPQDKINACFVPSSHAERKKVAGLYRINLEQNPVVSKLATCDQNVTWFENDVCWRCLSK